MNFYDAYDRELSYSFVQYPGIYEYINLDLILLFCLQRNVKDFNAFSPLTLVLLLNSGLE
jgi:hypothetical protein